MARGSLHELEADMKYIRTKSLASPEALNEIDRHIRRVEQLLAGLLRHLHAPSP